MPRGSSSTTWVYDKTVGTCDYPDNEEGRQYVSFDSPGNTAPTIRAVPRKDGGVVIHYLDDEEGLAMYSRAEALRNYEVLYSQMTPCSGDDPYGGEPTPDAIGTSTCNIEGQVEGSVSGELTDVLGMYYTSALERMDEPKASIYFSADGLLGTELQRHASLPRVTTPVSRMRIWGSRTPRASGPGTSFRSPAACRQRSCWAPRRSSPSTSAER